MSGSFRNVISIRDKSAIEPLSNKELSIGITPGGFLFAVMDSESSQYVALEEHLFANDEENGEPLVSLDAFFSAHPILSQTFQKVHLSYFSPHYVIIPASVYDPDSIESYLSFCAAAPENHQVVADQLDAIEAFGIYAIPDDLSAFAGKRFVDFRIRHQASVLMESFFANQREDEVKADVVLHLKPGHFEMLLIHQQKLLCYKSFFYQVFDDVLYYLFYLLELYGMDANQKNLMLIGELQSGTDEVAILESFFPKVTFPGRNRKFRFSEVFSDLPAHYYYNFFNLVKCG